MKGMPGRQMRRGPENAEATRRTLKTHREALFQTAVSAALLHGVSTVSLPVLILRWTDGIQPLATDIGHFRWLGAALVGFGIYLVRVVGSAPAAKPHIRDPGLRAGRSGNRWLVRPYPAPPSARCRDDTRRRSGIVLKPDIGRLRVGLRAVVDCLPRSEGRA